MPKSLHTVELAVLVGIQSNTLNAWFKEYSADMEQPGSRKCQEIFTTRHISFFKSVLREWKMQGTCTTTSVSNLKSHRYIYLLYIFIKFSIN